MGSRHYAALSILRQALVKVWLVTSWYGRKPRFLLPPGVGEIRVVNAKTLWVNGKLDSPPPGTWVWAMTPAVARSYTEKIKGPNHLLAAKGGHPSRLGRRRSIPLLKNRRWCEYLVRRLRRLTQKESSSRSDLASSSKRTGSNRGEVAPDAC